ncbi:MAG: hypothetical protein GC129_00510 [Proteobacteria bacterium]|nr:hypothetical protein [Pseudomonadota bacterium]
MGEELDALSAGGREAVEMVRAHILRQVGNYYGEMAIDAVYEAVKAWRDREASHADFPIPQSEDTLHATFYVAAGGTEYDQVEVIFGLDKDGKLTLECAWVDCDELWEDEPEDGEAAGGVIDFLPPLFGLLEEV